MTSTVTLIFAKEGSRQGSDKRSFLLLYLKLLCQLSRNTHFLLSFSSVLSYFVMDTSLSIEAVMKLKLSFTLKLSNPMLINFSEFCAITSIFFLIT